MRQDLATGYGVELRQTDDLQTLVPWNSIDLGTLSRVEGSSGLWDYSLTAEPDAIGAVSFWRLNFLMP